MVDESHGAIIRRARQEKRLTQAQLALQLGVHKNTVADWEKDKYFPDRHYHALNKILHISLGGPAEQGPDSTVPPDVLALIRRRYPDPEQQRQAIEALEEVGEPNGPHGEAQSAPEAGHAG